MSAHETGTATGEDDAPDPKGRGPQGLVALPWRMASVLAAVVVAAAGWLIVLAFCSLVWLGDDAGTSYQQVLEVSTQFWLLANGVPASLDGVRVSLVPLGLSAVIVVMVASAVSAIARKAVLSRGATSTGVRSNEDSGALAGSSGAFALRLAAWFAIPYLVILGLCTNLLGHPQSTGPAILGGLLVGGVVSLLSAGRTLHWRATGLSQGGWMSGVLAGVLAAAAALVIVAAVVLGGSLLTHQRDVIGIHQQLAPGGFGGIMLALLQVMWIPNAVLWTMSWLLGAGFTAGAGTLFSPTASHPGQLPAIPMLGALPTGAHSSALGLVWFLAAAVAGALGGAVAVRARRDAVARRLPPGTVGHDSAALLGLVVGLLTAVLVCFAELLAKGGFGEQQLAGLGASMPHLVVLAPCVLGAGAMIGGYLTSVLSHPDMGSDDESAPARPED